MIEMVFVTGSYSSAWKGFKPTQIWAIFSDRVGETLLFAMLFAVMLLLQTTERKNLANNELKISHYISC